VPAVDVSPRLVDAAVGGDQRALEQLLRAVVDDVGRLAQRMLWHPQDGEDATQEILVKVARRLSTFRGEASVTTWVHRIAVNHLLTTRRRRAEDPTLTFAAFGEDLARDLDAAYDSRGVDDELLAQEVMVGYTQGMLLCLDREHRVAYVLGEVLGLTSDEAADVCGIAPAAFRKRLQRARERIQQFMEGHCGLTRSFAPSHDLGAQRAPARGYDSARSRIALSRSRSLRFARRIAAATSAP
jgi:RNA polymerase sigma factor (sigma-70 family)